MNKNTQSRSPILLPYKQTKSAVPAVDSGILDAIIAKYLLHTTFELQLFCKITAVKKKLFWTQHLHHTAVIMQSFFVRVVRQIIDTIYSLFAWDVHRYIFLISYSLLEKV